MAGRRTALHREGLGLRAPFSLGEADFSGIADEPLFISDAIHRATITVDEWGTEAAAVTGLGFRESGPPTPDTTIHADRPFAFTIIEKQSSAPLFLGQVAQPEIDPAAAVSVSSPSDLYFPTQSVASPASGPAALTHGRLVERSGCLWLEDETGKSLPLWPEGWSLSETDGELVVRSGKSETKAVVGQRIALGGGEASDAAFLSQIVDEEPPP